jgi:hypothetical protein
MANFDYFKSVSKYCTPAQVYLVLAVIGLLSEFMISFSAITLIVHAIVAILFGYILNWVCNKGYTGLSWALVLLPYVLAVIFFGLAIDAKKANKEGF